jgi:hypothetical protein
MSKPRKSTIEVQGTAITILAREHGDYISLTDMVRNFEGGSLGEVGKPFTRPRSRNVIFPGLTISTDFFTIKPTHRVDLSIDLSTEVPQHGTKAEAWRSWERGHFLLQKSSRHDF